MRFALPLLLGCAGEPEHAGPDLEAMAAMMADDPAGAAAAVSALPDPLRRTAAVVALADRGVVLPDAFCDALVAGPARDRCFKMASRPHLTAGAPVGGRDVDRPAEGPSTVHLVPRSTARSAWADVTPLDVDCGQRPPLECRAELARLRVMVHEGEVAAQLCAGVPEERWRDECFFRSAEIAASRRDDSAATDAAELCLLTGPLMPRCFDHMVRRLGAAAPAADAPADAWRTALAVNHTIERPWANRDPGFGRHLRDRYWSYATLRAASLTPVATGMPLDHLPGEAHRHVRDAVAMRVVAEDLSPDTPLAEGEAALAAALALRPDAPAPRGRDPLAVAHPPPHWPQDGPGDEHIVATFHLGSGRRTWSPDAEVDARLALLEAAGLVDPPRRRLLEEAKASPVPQVRWTATRVLDDLDHGRVRPEHYEMPEQGDGLRAPPLADDDPRVPKNRAPR